VKGIMALRIMNIDTYVRQNIEYTYIYIRILRICANIYCVL